MANWTDVTDVTFKDLENLDVVGFYPNFEKRPDKPGSAKARETIDNAQMRYFIVHLHRLLDPATDVTKKKK